MAFSFGKYLSTKRASFGCKDNKQTNKYPPRDNIVKYVDKASSLIKKDIDNSLIFASRIAAEFTQTGTSLVDYSQDASGRPFVGPLVFHLDDEDNTGELPVFFFHPHLLKVANLLKYCRISGAKTFSYFQFQLRVLKIIVQPKIAF